MTKIALALLLTTLASASAMAQGPAESVGVIQGVDGLVTISQGNTLGNVAKDGKIVNGARVVTTSTGSTFVKLNNGCLINLAPNQAVTIDTKLDCKAQVASIQSTLLATTATGSGSAGSGALVAGIVGGLVLTGLIVNSNKDESRPPQFASGS